MHDNPHNPFQNMKLEAILEFLVKEYGWRELGERVKIQCFIKNPSIKSSLVFLRKTAWARAKVEDLYLETKRRENDAKK